MRRPAPAAAPLLGVVKDDPERQPLPVCDIGYAVAHLGPGKAPRTGNGSQAVGKYQRLSLLQPDRVPPALHAGTVLQEEELPAAEIHIGSSEQNGNLERERDRAVDILVLSVVAAGAVLEEQGGRSRLAGSVAAGQEVIERRIEVLACSELLLPAVRDPRKRRVEGGPKLRHRVRERIGEVAVASVSEAARLHVDGGTEVRVVREEPRQRSALPGAQQRSRECIAALIELPRDLVPIDLRDPPADRALARVVGPRRSTQPWKIQPSVEWTITNGSFQIGMRW